MNKCMKIVVFAAVLGCVVPATPARGQSNCQPIRLLLQANLDFARPLPYIGWSGKVRGFLNDNVPLDGMLYAAGPSSSYGTGQAGHEANLSFVFDFGEKGRFVTVADKGIFPLSPGVSPHMTYPPESAFGHYAYTAKVAPAPDLPLGTSGWFIKATGNISLSGMFLVNAPPPVDMGIWNAEINGRLCNVISQP